MGSIKFSSKRNDTQDRMDIEDPFIINKSNDLPNNTNPSGEPNIDPTSAESNTLLVDMNNLRQQWDSLYLANDADNLAKAYTEVVIVRKLDGSIKAKTRAQIKNSFNNKFAKIKTLSYSSQQTDAVMESDGTIRVRGTFVGMVDHIGQNSGPTQISGAYDRNVIYVNGKYKICKHNDIVN